MKRSIPFVGPAYKVRSGSINAQRCVNFYLEPGGPDSKCQAALIGTPGLRHVLTMPNAPDEIRAAHMYRSALIIVCGARVYSVSTDWVATEVGRIRTSAGPVSIAIGPKQFILVDGRNGWVYSTADSTFKAIDDEAFPFGARRVSYLDGRAIVESPSSNQFSYSAIGDFCKWGGLDFESAEGAPDNIVSHIVDHREVWLFGQFSTEIFVNTAQGLMRNGNAFIECGCAAAFSIAKLDNSLMWLGRDALGEGVVWRAQDYRPERVSDYGIEYAISTYERIDDAIAYAYQQDGHLFYVLIFPTAGATWVYDVSTGTWHERAAYNAKTGQFHRHRSNCHAFFNGEHVVGDFENGKLYVLDMDRFDDDGEILLSLRATQTLQHDQRQVFYGSLQVDIDPGTGVVEGQGADPRMMLRYSDDGGHTWSNRREARMGGLGEFRTRCLWNRLGRGRNRVWEISVSDPVRRVITGAYSNMNLGEG